MPRAEMRVRLFTTEPVGMVRPTANAETAVGDRPTVLQTVVERLSGHGPRAHEVWLPPLGAAPPLDVVLADAGPMGALTTAIGSVDRPFEQRRTPLCRRFIRSRRQCRCRRRTSIRKIDRFADTHHGAGRHSRSAHGAVLLPRLRRWGVGIAARLAARGFGRGPGGYGVGPSNDRSDRRHYSISREALSRPRDRVDHALPPAQVGT